MERRRAPAAAEDHVLYPRRGWRIAMKSAVALFVLFAALGCAQDEKPQAVKRLSAVTWNLETHKLEWTVEKGTVVDGEFVPDNKVKYEVSPDESFMAFAGEKRTLGEDEAASLHQVLNVLSVYCVESVVWWEHGQPDSPVQPAPGLVTKPDKPAPTKVAPAPGEKVVKVEL
jgi:hypothetical protein